MKSRCVAVFGLIGLVSLSVGAPAIFIIQQKTPERYGQTFDVPVAAHLAEELDNDGRVSPILWSMLDPVFRLAVEEKVLPKPSPSPELAEARAAAKKLRVDYILMLTAVRDKELVRAEVRLYRLDKLVWQDKKALAVSTGEAFNADATADSLARTWVIALNADTFKGLPTKRRDTPTMEPGQKPPDVQVPVRAKVDNRQLTESAAKLAKAGQTAQLFIALREAVDAEPLDAARRRLLIDYLASQGMPEFAAEEAKRAVFVLPEAAEFHVMAARAFMQAGDDAKAQLELNEAVARDPESFDTRLLLGELALLKLDVKAALDHLAKALSKGSSAEALFKRGLALALAGNADGAKKDVTDARKDGEDGLTAATRYAFVLRIADGIANSAGRDLRSVLQRVRLNRTDPWVRVEADRLTTAIATLSSLLDLPTCPSRHAPSHERRLLALNLLAQCIAQMETHVKDNDAEALKEATITLGEALKQQTMSREAYTSEMQKQAS